MDFNIRITNKAMVLFVIYLLLWILLHNLLTSSFPIEARIPSLNELWMKSNSLKKLFNDINFWSTSIGICIYISVELFTVSSIILIFSKLLKIDNSFPKSLLIVILAHIIFLIQHIIECLFLIKNTTFFNNVRRENFSFFSISYFFQIHKFNFNKSFNYLFQTISIFEIIYWIMLSLFLSKMLSIKIKNAIILISISYLPIFFLWLIAITFLNIMNS